MSQAPMGDTIVDPAELLNVALERAWSVLCRTYDISGKLPDMLTLFDGVDLASNQRAAEVILANMLLEVTEEVGRFSPCYRLPARAYGLISLRNEVTGCIRWMLAPEAVLRWRQLLSWIGAAVRRNSSLIQALLLVEQLMGDIPAGDPCVDASCACEPARIIRIKRSILAQAQIICDQCQREFVENIIP